VVDGRYIHQGGVVGLVPPHLDCGHGGPGWVPTGPVERVQCLGYGGGMCGGSSHSRGSSRRMGVCLVGYRLMAKFPRLKEIF